VVSLRAYIFIGFLIYGIPLWKLRYQWRSTVYRRYDWKINVLPWFGHDLAALFSNVYFRTQDERAMARRFRFYMVGYVVLLVAVIWM
jgi:hypothetical protein